MGGALLSLSEEEDRPLLVCGKCMAMFRSGFQRCPADGEELAPLEVDPFVGQLFVGRYQIEAFVGQGAMGRVYRARHARMPKNFAVKIMFGDLASDATMRARFQAEAEAASRLEHPHVVSVADFGDTAGGLAYMVMDFVEGEPLSKILEREGRLEPPRAVRLLRQIALGLQHAHDRGLVHRDLKADNVVVLENEQGEVARIVDFGIAMFADSPSAGKLTAVGVVIGTPAYMSPEQACGEKLDHRSDLFSLGITAYEMLAGKKPFDGHPFEIARQNIVAIAPPIGERSPGVVVSHELEAIVMKLLAKSRDDRFPSGQAVVDALDALADVPARPPRAPSRSERPTIVDLSELGPARGKRRWPYVAGAAVAALGVALALSFGARRSEPIAPAPDPSPLEGAALAIPPARGVETLSAASPIDEPAPLAEPEPSDDPQKPRLRKKARAKAGEEYDLTGRFREVTEQLNRVSAERGERAVASYRERFKRSRNLYNLALRDPSKQREAYQELTKLASDLQKLR